MRRKNFKEGDRTNFSFYDSIESYRAANPGSNPLVYAFAETIINRRGSMVDINVTSAMGRNISYLALRVPRPDYVIVSNVKLENNKESRQRRKEIGDFLRKVNAAEKSARNSTLMVC